MRLLRKEWVGWVALAIATAGWVASVGPASAQTARGGARPAEHDPAAARAAHSNGQPVTADFEGRRIDLSSTWQQARACIVMLQAKLVECFRSLADAEARVAKIPPQAAAYPYTCSSPLRLFEHNTYGGRQLLFFDRLFWQNLTDYGFNDQMTSFQVGACYSYLAEHTGGGGALYPPGPLPPWTAVAWPAAGWDNRVSSIYMA